jgi:hypothetical protein
MSRVVGFLGLLLLAGRVPAADLQLDFSRAHLGDVPPGFRSAVSGDGKPGTWKIVEDSSIDAAASLPAGTTVVVRHQALAQLDRQNIEEHFPLLVYEGASFTDFKLTTRIKTVEGTMEQMAGIAFRIQDDKNYYVVRVSSLGNNFRFYKFVDGNRTTPLGPQLEIPHGKWHDLIIECKGNQIRCELDGNEAISVTDNTYAEGKIGFWTKSDAVSFFGDTAIVYTPSEMLAAELIRKAMKDYPRLLGMQIFSTTSDRAELHLVASSDPAEVGRAAGPVEKDVISRAIVYGGKENKKFLITMPLRDRNGDPIAAVRFILEAFPGQTEDNAAARARPIVKEMETRVRSVKDLTR